jgi:hypothetical protein
VGERPPTRHETQARRRVWPSEMYRSSSCDLYEKPMRGDPIRDGLEHWHFHRDLDANRAAVDSALTATARNAISL